MQELYYGGVQPPSGNFSGRMAVNKVQTNHIIRHTPTPTPNPTGYQTAKYNANQQVYIPNPYGVGPLTEKTKVFASPPKIIIPQKQ